MKWLTFINERFSPLVYIPTIALLVGSIFSFSLPPSSSLGIMIIFLFVTVFLLKLRIYDEIKDYDTDLEINPHRPLPRGLISLSEAKKAFKACLILEALLASFFGVGALSTTFIAILYSLLMYREFFIPHLLRDKLTTYAIMHTIVISMISLAVYSMVLEKPFYELELKIYLCALINWPLFNFFEFVRKTYTPEEERPGVQTYSSIFSLLGASLLSLSQIAFAIALAYAVQLEQSLIDVMIVLFSLFLLVSLFYSFSKSKSRSKVFQGAGSLILFLLYLTLSLPYLKGLSYVSH